MQILEKILEYIFLPACGVCGKLGEGYLCKNCEKELEKYSLVRKNRCENINNILDIKYNAVTKKIKGKGTKICKLHVFKYEDVIRKLILNYKFNDKSYLYKTFCEFIVKNKKIVEFIKSYDIIIPVPMFKTKIRKRGYNQSELMAKEIAKNVGIKVYTDVLIKIKDNKVQSSLNKQDREENTKNVYNLVNLEKIYNKKVLIFDDIYTTGSTVEACIKEIEKAKPSKIGILTLAKD